MKHIILFLIFASQIFASTINSSVKSIDELNHSITIEINKIDVGISGFIIHKIDANHEMILKNVTVSSFDKDTKIASLQMSNFNGLVNNALPNINYKVEVGDEVVLAFGYSRALLIAPSEELYHRITKAVRVQWIHPDLFTTILSLNGHLAPTQSDFIEMTRNTSIGLIYFFINKKLYTVDAKSFKILNISLAPLKQKTTMVPYYTRVKNMSNAWWNFGAGTKEVKDYNSYYYKLLLKYNPKNQELIAEINR